MAERRGGRALSLRTRLLVAFIALAVLPCLVLTIYISHRLTRSLELWGNPGVERTVDSSVRAARGAVRALQSHLLQSVETMAEGGPAPGGLDVLRIYERVEGRYTLRQAEPSAAGLLITPEEIDGALEGSRLIERREGWLLALAACDPTAERVVVGGYRLPPELYAQIAEARRGASLFERLRLYLAVSKGWIWLSTGLVALAVLAASSVLARFMAHGLTRPIVDLAEALDRVGRGDPVGALALPRDPEMAFLVGSFNRMAAELERSRRELRRAERLAAWQEVARKVAHEIKNPLTPIQFAIHRLKRELGAPAAAAGPGAEAAAETGAAPRLGEALDAILGEVETLRHVADEFSRLAKLPAPELRRVDAGRLLGEVVDLYREAGGALEAGGAGESSPARVTWEARIDPDLPPVLGDPRLLRQVFTNLVKNAIEAMPAGGRCEVSAQATANGTGPEVVLEIADSGPGVPEDLVERVGEPYVTTKKGGSGLGLAIVQKIVLDHRGRFELRNRPEGGAVARVVLPASAPGADAGSDER